MISFSAHFREIYFISARQQQIIAPAASTCTTIHSYHVYIHGIPTPIVTSLFKIRELKENNFIHQISCNNNELFFFTFQSESLFILCHK